MQQESASFWADIKQYEERLAQHPDSYLFARLSDAYLRLNLLDDALHTARQGVSKFPAYVAGQRVLALACYAKGLLDESRHALEMVAAATPEDAEIQKTLGRLLVASGDREAAERVYRVVLDFYPDDAESHEELRGLAQPAPLAVEERTPGDGEAGLSLEPFLEQEDEIIDLLDDDVLMEIVEVSEPPVTAAPPRHDPLSTVTLAELYVQQGFVSKALGIYRSLCDEDPTNVDALSRIAELEAQETEVGATASIVEQHPIHEQVAHIAVQEVHPLPPGIPVQGEADAAVATLEGWLDTIRRIKACR